MDVLSHHFNALGGEDGAKVAGAEVTSDVTVFERVEAPVETTSDFFVFGYLFGDCFLRPIATAIEVDLGLVDAVSDLDSVKGAILH